MSLYNIISFNRKCLLEKKKHCVIKYLKQISNLTIE